MDHHRVMECGYTRVPLRKTKKNKIKQHKIKKQIKITTIKSKNSSLYL